MRYLCILIALLGVASGRIKDNANSLDEESSGLHDDIESPFRNALADRSRAFTNGVVPYTISKDFTADQVENMKTRMANIERFTKSGDTPCITFRPKTDQDTSYVAIQKSITSECSSDVGMLSPATQIHAGASCLQGNSFTPMLMRALGFYYEQQRSDRDNHVTVDCSSPDCDNDKYRIIPGSTNQSIPYDYASVLHLEKYVTPKRYNYLGGRRRAMGLDISWYDVLRVQRFYQCQENFTEFKYFYEAKFESYCTFDIKRWCNTRKDRASHFAWTPRGETAGRKSDRGNYLVAEAKDHQNLKAIWSSYLQTAGCYNFAVAYYRDGLKDGNRLRLAISYDRASVVTLKWLTGTSGDSWTQFVTTNTTKPKTYWYFWVEAYIGPFSKTDIIVDDILLSKC